MKKVNFYAIIWQKEEGHVMENLYIYKSALTKRNHLVTAGSKSFYINPLDKAELIVDLGNDIEHLDDDTFERLEVLYMLNDDLKCKNINLPLRRAYINDIYRAYALPRIMDPCDLFTICFTSGIDLNTRLDIIKRFDDAVSYLHKMGIISCDLNATNLILDENCNGHIIDLVDSQYDKFLVEFYDRRLLDLYGRNFNDCHLPYNIDNVSMHLNLLFALFGNDEYSDMSYSEQKEVLRKLKVPNQVKETFIRMTDYDELDTIPYVTETIEQIL